MRTVAPVSANGRVFSQGENIIMAFDAYNGVKLWDKPIQGAMRTGVSNDSGNMVLTKDALYVAARDVCYRLNPANGEEMAVYRLPPGPDDGNSASGAIWPATASCSTARVWLLPSAVPRRWELARRSLR